MRAAGLWRVLLPLASLALLEGFARLLPLGLPDLADLHVAWSTGERPVFARRGETLTTAPALARQDNSPESFSPEKRPGVVRVFCVGDSTTAGWPWHPAGAYPRWLAAILADVRPDLRVEVINAGFHGFDSGRCLSVVREISAYSPDVIVFHAGYDDYHLFPERRSRLFRVHSWLVLHSQTYNLVRRLGGHAPQNRDLQPPVPLLDASEQDALVDAFVANVKAAVAAGRAAKAAVVLADLPFNQAAAPTWPGWASLVRMRAAQKSLAAEKGWAFAPLDDVEKGARFVDHVHCDVDGYRLLALDVARTLERSGALPPGPWRWSRLRSPRELARAAGLDDPAFNARLAARLAGLHLQLPLFPARR